MTPAKPARHISNAHNAALSIAAALILVACATSESPRTPPRIEVPDEFGFTITEVAPVDSEVRLEYGEALHYLEQGEFARGIAMLESVAEAAPGLSAPRIDLGIAYHRAGELEKAKQSLLHALELNPAHPVAHNELGIIYREIGRFADARQSYEAALAIYPGYHYARRNLAILCDLYLADLDCALQNYEAYMATVPNDDEAKIWIADIRNRLAQ